MVKPRNMCEPQIWAGVCLLEQYWGSNSNHMSIHIYVFYTHTYTQNILLWVRSKLKPHEYEPPPKYEQVCVYPTRCEARPPSPIKRNIWKHKVRFYEDGPADNGLPPPRPKSLAAKIARSMNFLFRPPFFCPFLPGCNVGWKSWPQEFTLFTLFLASFPLDTRFAKADEKTPGDQEIVGWN